MDSLWDSYERTCNNNICCLSESHGTTVVGTDIECYLLDKKSEEGEPEIDNVKETNRTDSGISSLTDESHEDRDIGDWPYYDLVASRRRFRNYPFTTKEFPMTDVDVPSFIDRNSPIWPSFGFYAQQRAFSLNCLMYYVQNYLNEVGPQFGRRHLISAFRDASSKEAAALFLPEDLDWHVDRASLNCHFLVARDNAYNQYKYIMDHVIKTIPQPLSYSYPLTYEFKFKTTPDFRQRYQKAMKFY